MSIEIKDLTHIYSKGTPYEKLALDGVNLKIEKNEFIGLIGHTGSGKSTLIQHLNALLKPTSGQVYINGENIFRDKKKLSSIREKVGLVFQYPEHQLFEMSVFKDIAFGPTNMGMDEDEVKGRVYAAMEKVGLDHDVSEKSPFELSGGQKRRVAIAGVMAMGPEVLILDEPTAGLDPHGRDEILDEIKKLQNEMTIILVSHCMEDVANYVDRIVVMDKGKVLLDGDKYEVFSKYDKMTSIGLGVPQVTRVCKSLKDLGYPIDNTVTTIEEAVTTLYGLLK